MKAFASWSGGKDCMLAAHRFLRRQENKLCTLVNMCDNNGAHSRSHGLNTNLIKAQAYAMGIPVIQEPTGFSDYEVNFKKVINRLKEKDVTVGIFGDIYLMEHRIWIERVCEDLLIEPVFPLWGNNTSDLLKEFIDTGFEALTVAVNNQKLNEEWLGRILDMQFYTDIQQLNDIDPCAENGEYHSFVYNGPEFNKPVSFSKGAIRTENTHSYLEIY